MSESLIGAKELSRKLAELETATAAKALRSAAVLATTPALKEMKASVPVGDVAHRTYKGRLVAPGFLKRSIRRSSFIKNGVVNVVLGVRAEAFYGVQFVEQGTVKMEAQPWFVKSFTGKREEMERRMVEVLRKKIEKVARS